MVKKLPGKLYKKIYSVVPRLCVDVIINHKDGIVLAKRDIPPCKNMWHIPGGTILLGENLDEAVKRIAKEETGLNVEIKKQIEVKEYSRKSAFGQAISIVYHTKSIGGKLRGNEYGHYVKSFKKIPKNIISEQREMLGV